MTTELLDDCCFCFECRKIDRNKGVTDLQKRTISFQCSKMHDEEEISEFADVSHSQMKLVFKQWSEI